MKTPLIFFLSLIVFCCSNGQNSGQEKASTFPPVETDKPNADYAPAFTGQTRIKGIKTTQNYSVTVLSEKLDRPWGITSLPDGRFLITEKKGNFRIADKAGKLSGKISGLPEVNTEDQGGLLGLTLDPDFTINRMVYWVFSENKDGGTCTSVAKGKLSDDESKILNAQVIYRALPAFPSTLHYGGRILFDKAGNIFVSTGERSDIRSRPQAQQLNSALGKIIRITKEGKAAADNPFINSTGVRPEIYSFGHRNIQSLAFHPVTGDLWEAEFGPKGGDELNLIQAGKNYGWPDITYGLEYNGKKINNGLTQKAGMEQPVYYWDPVLSPSGMTFYNGEQMMEWKNDLFICGLNSNHIARLKMENNKVIGEERLLSDQGQRFRDICVGKDGALFAVTDEGRLYRISK